MLSFAEHCNSCSFFLAAGLHFRFSEVPYLRLRFDGKVQYVPLMLLHICRLFRAVLIA